jgi:SAM-dependent methyltransferase
MRKAVDYVCRNFHYIRPSQWRAAAKALYRRFSKSGIFISEDEMPMCSLFPERMLSKVVARFNPKSVLDVGCGTGRALEFFLSKGLDAFGIEGSAIARAKSLHPDRILPCDLRKPVDLGRTFDLVWCFEVAEHIHSRFTDVFIQTMARHAPLVVMSAAPPGQGGEGHFNEQPKTYWIAKAAEVGFKLDTEATAELASTREFYSDNVMVFVRNQPENHFQ